VTLSRRHRQVLAVLAVTTALCADQVSAAAPALREQVAELPGRIVSRLTQSFGRTVSAAPQVLPEQRASSARASTPVQVEPAVAPVNSQRLISPFQFRLPPPTL
jgi:hypothetical protein